MHSEMEEGGGHLQDSGCFLTLAWLKQLPPNNPGLAPSKVSSSALLIASLPCLVELSSSATSTKGGLLSECPSTSGDMEGSDPSQTWGSLHSMSLGTGNLRESSRKSWQQTGTSGVDPDHDLALMVWWKRVTLVPIPRSEVFPAPNLRLNEKLL